MADPQFAIAEPIRTIHPEQVMRLDVVSKINGLSSSAIYRRMAKDMFPKPKAFGDRVVAWPTVRVLD